jgi:TPR repeat protein
MCLRGVSRPMIKISTVFIILLSIIVGCTSSPVSLYDFNTHNYLKDTGFSNAYKNYLEADLEYLKSFGKDKQAVRQLSKASEQLKPFAQRGNPIAQLCYGQGKYLSNIKLNAPLYTKMLIQSANTGYLPATRNLGGLYSGGYNAANLNFVKNIPKALDLLERNSEYGHERDIKKLLGIYKHRLKIDVKSNKYKELEIKLAYSQDASYQYESAIKGNLKAQRVYGHMLYYGQNIDQNYIEAAYWLMLAVSNSKNTQKAYDSARIIYALSELSEHERFQIEKRVNLALLANKTHNKPFKQDK